MWGLDAARPERGASATEGRGGRGIARLGRPPSAESRGHPRRGQRPCPAVPGCAPGSACFEALGGSSTAERSATQTARRHASDRRRRSYGMAGFIRALRRNTAGLYGGIDRNLGDLANARDA